MANKVKLFKNPNRQTKVEHSNYVPQYKEMGISPKIIDYPNFKQLHKAMIKPPSDNQFHSSTQNSHNMPNVGNNKEHAWNSSDSTSELIDDLNDEYLEVNASDMFAGKTEKDYYDDDELQPSIDGNKSSSLDEEISSLAVGSYFLFIKNVFITSGTPKYVQSQAELLIYGEHELCDNQKPFDVQDIVVLKKLDIRVGIFLEG